MTNEEKSAFYSSIGENIKNCRSAKKMRQEDLAKRVGISRVSIVNIEKGRQTPPIHVIWLIAKSLGVGIEQIFPKEVTMEPEVLLKEIVEHKLPPFVKKELFTNYVSDIKLDYEQKTN